MSKNGFYVFTGPEVGEKNDAIARIKTLAQKKVGNFDSYTYYAGDTRLQDIIAQLRNGSLFTPALFITVRNAELLKGKEDIALLTSWVNATDGGDDILVLVSDENGIEKKIENLALSDHKKIFWELFESNKIQWVNSFFKKNGFSIRADAVEQILDMLENNTETLKSECSRFFYCFEKGHTITVADVEKILAHNREENAFTLFEAMADSTHSPKERLESSLEILQKIRLSKDSNGIALIAGLTYCFRQLREWHKLHSKSAHPTDVQLKIAGFSGKTNQARYASAARVWSYGSCLALLALLSATDASLREDGAALEDTRLVLLLYAAIIKNGSFCAEYENPLD